MPSWFHVPESWILAVKKLQYYFGLSIATAGILVSFWGFLVLFFKSGSLFEPDKLIALSRLIAGAFAMGVGGNLLLSNQHHLGTSSLDEDTADDNLSIHTGGGNYNELISGNYNESISGDYIQGDCISIQGDYISMNSDLSEVATQLLEIVTLLKAEGNTKEDAQLIIAEELATHAHSNRVVRVQLRKWKRSLDHVAVKTPALEVAKAVVDAASVTDSLPDHLNSSLSAKYSQLEALLRANNWEDADRETALIIARAYQDEEQEGQDQKLGSFYWWDMPDDIKMFPGRDLRHINNLWVKYSGGHFGFSVQKEIWKEVGGDYQAFGDRVGWRVEGDWILYSDITYHQNAPSGHLPITVMMLSCFSYSNSCDDAELALQAFVSRQYQVY
ncbi:MAG: GUN4 domain-containing protein [Cyanobacteriota bacterium]